MKIRWMDGNYFVVAALVFGENPSLRRTSLARLEERLKKNGRQVCAAPTARGDDKYINPSQDDGIGYSLTGKCHQPIQDETAFTEQQSGQVITTHSLTH